MRMLTIGLFIGMPNAFGRICIHMLVFYILIVISQSYPQQSWYCTLSTSQFELFRVVGLHQWMWEMNIPDYCKDFYLNQWPCRLTWHSCTDWMQSSWLSVVFQMERIERSTEQGDSTDLDHILKGLDSMSVWTDWHVRMSVGLWSTVVHYWNRVSFGTQSAF